MSINLSKYEILDIIESDKEHIVVDVRTKYEFKTNHFIGSINVPLLNIEKVSDYVSDKNTYIFLYCATGLISEDARKKLKKIGYCNAYNMGGIYNYSEYLYIE